MQMEKAFGRKTTNIVSHQDSESFWIMLSEMYDKNAGGIMEEKSRTSGCNLHQIVLKSLGQEDLESVLTGGRPNLGVSDMSLSAD